MMKAIIKSLGGLLLVAALSARAAAPDAAPAASASGGSTPGLNINDLLPDKVVAKGKGFEVRRTQLDQAVVNAQANAAARGQAIPPGDVQLVELRSLQYLIRIQLLNGIATADQKAKGRDAADKYYDELKSKAQSEDVMIRRFKAAGLTPETFRKGMAEEETAKLVLLSKVNITDDDIKKFYDNNPDKFEKPEEVTLRFITMGGPNPETRQPLPDSEKEAKKKQLADIRERALKGEDFATLAKQYSEDGEAKTTGGEMTIVRGLPRVPAVFEDTAFSLKTNEISQVITTDFGSHIIKMVEKAPAGKATLEEARDSIKSLLESRQVQKMLPAFEAQLRKDAGVEIIDERLKDLEAKLPPDSSPDSAGAPANTK